MSSSINSRPVLSHTKGSKAAVIRPVNRRDGKQSYVRIDVPEGDAARSHQRTLQLEDYIAQIRDEKSGPTDSTEATPVAELEILKDISEKQQLTTRELTQADHLDILKTVRKLDNGQQWIEDQNRAAAIKAMEERRQVSAGIAEQAENTPSHDVSPQLISSIAAAIASVLTDQSEGKSSQELDGTDQLDISEETLKLSPELPRPEYTLPITSDVLPESKTAIRIDTPQATKTVSLTAAAWDVPGFRWPEVTNSILSHGGILSRLAQSCTEMLSPFGKTIAVTSPTRGQGTSTMAMTLARMFASNGSQVLLVDADITNPNLSRTIGLEGIGWFGEDQVSDPIGESIIYGRNSGVCVMPLKEQITSLSANSDPLFDQLETCIDHVRSEFDLVVIDAGPVWQIVDEISSNSHLIDAAMIVNQDTHSHGFSEARERLMDRGVFKFIAAQNAFAKRAG